MRGAGRVALVAGGAWAVAAFVVITLVFGSPSRGNHQSPDEAGVAHSTALVADTGRPVAPLPFDDPGGLVMQRGWVRVDGGNAHATSPPGHYVLGLPTALPGGAWWRFLLPAAGLGALVAGIALLLPRRAWLAATVPGLAFPATFWWLRPWHNTSTMLALAGLAVLGVGLWRRTGRFGWSVAATGAAALAATVRPDQVHVIMGLSLLGQAMLARDRRGVWRQVAVHAGAAILALVVLLAGNLATTGDPLVTPVDLLDFPDEVEPAGRDLGFPWSQLVLIFASRGWPDWGNVGEQGARYLLDFGPMIAVAVLGLVVGAAAWSRPRGRWRSGAAVAVAALLVWYPVSRVSETDLGADAATGMLQHSLPRYSSIVFLAVAVLVVWAVTRLGRGALAASAGAVVVAVSGAAFVLWAAPPQQSLLTLRGQLRQGDVLAAAVDAEVPADAALWVRFSDKWLWDTRAVALWVGEREDPPVPEADRVVPAVVSARAAGFEPWFLELTEADAEVLRGALAEVGLTLEQTGFVPPGASSTPPRPTYRVVASG